MKHVVVVGAGPAGLAAAAAASAHARVTLIDSAPAPGGQFWRHTPASPDDLERPNHLLHRWREYRELRAALTAHPHCELLQESTVWAIEPGETAPRLQVLTGEADGTRRRRLLLTPDALILATGAHDRTLPFPGWDLPGVHTAGAAQVFAKTEGLSLGSRVLVAGAGPFLLPAALSAAATGSRVLGVLEAGTASALASGWLPRPWQFAATPGKGVELAGYVTAFLRRRIPYRIGSGVVAAHGEDRVEAVTVASLAADWSPMPGTERRIEVDALLVSHGFTPRLELAVAAGCAISSARFVVVDGAQRTSAPGVWAAGEVTGIGGADLALAEGRIAGLAAVGAPADAATLRTREHYRAFAARLDRAHGIGAGWTGWLTPETVLCRCEETTVGRFRETVAATESRGLRATRLSTRAGLGICQGRICGATVEELLRGDGPTDSCGVGADAVAHARADAAPQHDATSDRRPVATPIRLAELADAPAAD